MNQEEDLDVKMHMLRCICFAALLLLPACAVGPDFWRPLTKAESVSTYENTPKTYTAQPSKEWWKRIDDPLFNLYVHQLLRENLDLKQAGERVIQAREQVNIQRGGFFPGIGADSGASRSFSAVTTPNRNFTNSFNAELSTSWEIDLFGRIRRSVESAGAEFEARLFDREALTQSLIAELLQRRVAIAVNKNLLDLAQQNADNREKIYELVKNRYDLGVEGTALNEVFLAEENFTSVTSDIHQFERLLADETYRLDVLLGQVPGTSNPLSERLSLLPPPLDAAVCVPADLLDRRPDLRAAELRVKAANADIGVAIADLYPTLSLGGSLGFSGNTTNDLFTADQLAGSILSSITARLFEGGSLRANIRLQESEARELAASYAAATLEAMREVETALQADRALAREMLSDIRAAEALRKAEKISEERYLRGILSLQDYLDTQQRRYTAEQTLLFTQQEKWNTRIALYLALGGDWLGHNRALEACGKQEQG